MPSCCARATAGAQRQSSHRKQKARIIVPGAGRRQAIDTLASFAGTRVLVPFRLAIPTPFGLAVAWWAWADSSGYTKRKAMQRENAKRQERIDRHKHQAGGQRRAADDHEAAAQHARGDRFIQEQHPEQDRKHRDEEGDREGASRAGALDQPEIQHISHTGTQDGQHEQRSPCDRPGHMLRPEPAGRQYQPQ